MSTELTLPEQATTDLKELKQLRGSQQKQSFPTLQMGNTKSKDADLGEWILKYQEDGEDQIHSFGDSVDVVLLLHRSSYSTYDAAAEELTQFTNEFDDFSENKFCRLLKKGDNGFQTEWQGSQADFRRFRNAMPEEKKKSLKYRHIYYVYIPAVDKTARLFVGNTAYTGVSEEGEFGDFKNPLQKSFLHVQKLLQASGVDWVEQTLTLGHSTVYQIKKGKKSDEINYLVTTIEKSESNEESLSNRYATLLKNLLVILQKEDPRPDTAPADVIDADPIQYESDVKPEDLPF